MISEQVRETGSETIEPRLPDFELSDTAMLREEGERTRWDRSMRCDRKGQLETPHFRGATDFTPNVRANIRHHSVRQHHTTGLACLALQRSETQCGVGVSSWRVKCCRKQFRT
jgi:hypothetical protein